jgi:hypothetical protein
MRPLGLTNMNDNHYFTAEQKKNSIKVDVPISLKNEYLNNVYASSDEKLSTPLFLNYCYH